VGQFHIRQYALVDFRNSQMDSNTIIDSKSRLVWDILNKAARP